MSEVMLSCSVDRSYKVGFSGITIARRANAVQHAIAILHSRRRPARQTVSAASEPPNTDRVTGGKGKSELKGTPSIVGMKQWLQQIGHSVCLVSSLWSCTDKQRLPKSTTSTSFTSPALRAKAVHVPLSSQFFELTGKGPDGHGKQVYTLRRISFTLEKGYESISSP